MYDPIMLKAIAKASEIPYQQKKSRHYAILVDKRGVIVAEGKNDYNKTHPKFKKAALAIGDAMRAHCHAEFLVLHRDKYKRGYKLYVARVDYKNKPINSNPCPVCWKIISMNKHIKSIEWT